MGPILKFVVTHIDNVMAGGEIDRHHFANSALHILRSMNTSGVEHKNGPLFPDEVVNPEVGFHIFGPVAPGNAQLLM